MPKKNQKPTTIQELYPDLFFEQQTDADYRIKAYVNLVWRIYNRLKDEGRFDEIKKDRLRHEWEKRSKTNEF